MWHLDRPTQETLDWYKGLFLDKISMSIKNNKRLPVKVKSMIFDGTNISNLEKLLTFPPETLYNLNDELEDNIKSINLWTNSNIDLLLKLFNYDGYISKSQKNSYELARRIGRNTCVYCNRVYTITVIDDNDRKIVRPDFDHWLAKDKHPMLSMSFYNLIPSCPICNRGIKLRREFLFGRHVHPYCSNAETSFKFDYVPCFDSSWGVRIVNATQDENETAKVLETEQVYNVHGNLEVKDMIEFVYKNSPEYLKELFEKIMQAYGGMISAKEAYQIMLGTSPDASSFLDRPLSKLKRDVLVQILESYGI